MPENIHDKGYRRLLGKKRNFLSLVRDFIAEPWVYGLKEENLELVDKNFIPPDFREKESDLIYQATVQDRKVGLLLPD